MASTNTTVKEHQKQNEELWMQIDKLNLEKDLLNKNIINEKELIKELQEQIERLEVIRAKVTAYSPSDDRNGINADANPSITSTGKTPGKIYAAADPKRLPYGTKIYIPNFGEVEIQDTGGALRNDKKNVRIDIFKETYEGAIAWGIQDLDIRLVY
ncbi:3D domain-containing protein [Alkaliphilus metalliredigens]|nr:3D domain-containing protein [Alkaliphilus metalliredigens]